MNFGIAAPVGESISLRQHVAPATLLEGQLTSYFQSGTAALAAAITLVKDTRGLIKPNVIIPSYCCPDLVSAGLFAGVELRAADTQPTAPFYCIDSLESMIDQNTLAIICVNFCGLHDQLNHIQQRLEAIGCQATIIEDWAQYHPATPHARAPVNGIAIRSFGKGKPASILTGGAVIYSPELKQQAEVSWNGFQFMPTAISGLKIRAFNTVLTPEFYALAIHLGLIRPGLTHYHPLEAVVRHQAEQFGNLSINITAWQSGPSNAQTALIEQIGHLPGLQTISALDDYRADRLLRIPLTISSRKKRDQLLTLGAKLGISAMYQKPISAVSGVPSGALTRISSKNAEILAGRLITLPCHSRLRSAHLRDLQQLIAGVAGYE